MSLWIEFAWLCGHFYEVDNTCIISGVIWSKLCVASGFRRQSRLYDNLTSVEPNSLHFCAPVSLSVTHVYFSHGSYCWSCWHCFRWSTLPLTLSQTYIMGKRSVIPLVHFEHYQKIPQKASNFCPPLGVENLKGFQLQGPSLPDSLTRGSTPGPCWVCPYDIIC